jgi:glutathione peroxidase
MKLGILIVINFFFLLIPLKDVPTSIYDFKVDALKGGTIDFAQFKGKKILIVNTTSRDDSNREYAQLEAMYQKYKDKLVIIGFLIDDFATAPGSKKDPVTLEKNYNVSFPLASKVLIKGDNRALIYKWLTDKKYNKLKDSEVKWDFQKYLINEKGELIADFEPKIKCDNPLLIEAVEKK